MHEFHRIPFIPPELWIVVESLGAAFAGPLLVILICELKAWRYRQLDIKRIAPRFKPMQFDRWSVESDYGL